MIVLLHEWSHLHGIKLHALDSNQPVKSKALTTAISCASTEVHLGSPSNAVNHIITYKQNERRFDVFPTPLRPRTLFLFKTPTATHRTPMKRPCLCTCLANTHSFHHEVKRHRNSYPPRASFWHQAVSPRRLLEGD